jgi:hypothetical protein
LALDLDEPSRLLAPTVVSGVGDGLPVDGKVDVGRQNARLGKFLLEWAVYRRLRRTSY